MECIYEVREEDSIAETSVNTLTFEHRRFYNFQITIMQSL